jgi:TPR repeat protein
MPFCTDMHDDMDESYVQGRKFQEERLFMQAAISYRHSRCPYAFLRLLEMSRKGQLPLTDQEVLQLISEAAARGHSNAQFRLAKANASRGMMGLSAYQATLAANQGHVGAQTFVGMQYAVGQGVPKDLKKALYWLSIAAERDCGESKKYVDTVKRRMHLDSAGL